MTSDVDPKALAATTTLRLHEATKDWASLMEQIDSFSLAWDQAAEQPPEIESFLPTEPPILRHMVLVELIKIDLEFRWQEHNCPKTIEQYLAEFPELGADGPPADLIHEEYQIRRRLPDAPAVAVYLSRFPRQADQLQKLLKLSESERSSTRVIDRARGPETPVDVGQQIDDFDLLTRLVAGAFATVFLARQRSMQRLVALKISKDRGTESQTLAQLDHPYIVRVFDQRTLPERNLRLMYMQHIPGGTLQNVVSRVRDLPVAEQSGRVLLDSVDQALLDRGETRPADSAARRRLAQASWPAAVCWLGARLGDALHYAHRRGVLHRDVKPANVLLDAEANPKLADFNVSFSSKLDGATPAAYFGGSLAYMSPEQLEASNPEHPREPDSLDGRSDVYSLAIMLWEMLSGTRPFPDEAAATWLETLRHLVKLRQSGISEQQRRKLPPRMPPGMADLLIRCLSANPDERPADAGEFSRLLQLCLHPRAQKLLQPARGSASDWIRHWPAVAIVLCCLIPNAIMTAFNLQFNFELVMDSQPPAIRDMFFHSQVLTVNSIAYTLGIGTGIWWIWPVLQAIRSVQSGQRLPAERLADLRRYCLWFGDAIMWITIAGWLIAGLTFPIWLHLAVDYEAAHYATFIPSMALCGLIAATATYFVAAYVTVHGFYPALLGSGEVSERDEQQMQAVIRRSWRVFVATVTAPLLAVVIATLHPESSVSSIYKASVLGLAVIGLSASALGYILVRQIQADIAALATALSPQASSAAGGDTGSFWTGTH